MASYLGRRKFLATLLGGVAASLAGSPFALARQQAMPVIGFVNAGSAKGGYARPVSAFRQGLSVAARCVRVVARKAAYHRFL